MAGACRGVGTAGPRILTPADRDAFHDLALEVTSEYAGKLIACKAFELAALLEIARETAAEVGEQHFMSGGAHLVAAGMRRLVSADEMSRALERQGTGAHPEENLVGDAERHVAERLLQRHRELRIKNDAPFGEHVGRYGDDDGARLHGSGRRVQREALAAPVDSLHRRLQPHIEVRSGAHDDTAEPLTHRPIDFRVFKTRQIDARHRIALDADVPGHDGIELRSHLVVRNELAHRYIAAGAHRVGHQLEVALEGLFSRRPFLGTAHPGTDSAPPVGRTLEDRDALLASECGPRVLIGAVQPGAAAIEWQAEARGVRMRTTADAIACFENERPQALAL